MNVKIELPVCGVKLTPEQREEVKKEVLDAFRQSISFSLHDFLIRELILADVEGIRKETQLDRPLRDYIEKLSDWA